MHSSEKNTHLDAMQGFEVVESTVAIQHTATQPEESPLPELEKLQIDAPVHGEEEPLEVISSDSSSSETSSSGFGSDSDEVYIIKLHIPKGKHHGKHKSRHDHRRSRGHSPPGWSGMKDAPFGSRKFGPWGAQGHHGPRGHGRHGPHGPHHPRHADNEYHKHHRGGHDKIPPPPPPFPACEGVPPPFPPHQTERGCPPGPPPFPFRGHPRGPPPPRGPSSPPGTHHNRGVPPPPHESESETCSETELPPRGPPGHHFHHQPSFGPRRGRGHHRHCPPPHFEAYNSPFSFGPGAHGPRAEYEQSVPSPDASFGYWNARPGHTHHFGPSPPPPFGHFFGGRGGREGSGGRGRHHGPFERPEHLPFEDYEFYSVH